MKSEVQGREIRVNGEVGESHDSPDVISCGVGTRMGS
jgi:hypothetical protein